ncbi:hypothetical protein [Sulfurimonas sp. CS5]|uniref:hypothetical protein n=1 Tax=Sulfurimonas sp. CS5 TaxID=3391145 RepID=UPI0039EAF88F
MHSHYIQEMEKAVEAIIKRDSLSELWRDRTHVISVAKETKNLNTLNDIFDTFIKYEETIDIGIYSAIRDNHHIDQHLKEELNGCHTKLTQPTLDELNDMEMYLQ